MPKVIFLSSGTPVILQKINNFHSFVLGIWIKYGSRHEPAPKSGLSHFIEHLFFQGTEKRDAKTISLEIDSIGGDLNAFTAREFTSIYVKGLKKSLVKSVELICDVYSNPLFPEEEIEKERSIILDEIRMVNDTPEEFTHDFFMEKVFGETLGLPILGKSDTIPKISREDIIEIFERFYGINNTFISCAGNFDENLLIEQLEKNLKRRSSKDTITSKEARFIPTVEIYQKDFHEVHICLGFETVPFKSELRNSLAVLNCIVGGSVSSRLFQEIREKRGLAYNVYSFVSLYSDTGVFGIYTACESSKVNEILRIIKAILKDLPKSINHEEIERAKNQIVSQILYSSESSSSAMQNLAYQYLYLNRIHNLKEQQSQIRKITMKDVRKVAEYLTTERMGLVLVGPFSKDKLDF